VRTDMPAAVVCTPSLRGGAAAIPAADKHFGEKHSHNNGLQLCTHPFNNGGSAQSAMTIHSVPAAYLYKPA
jgi:hypothetical protein